MAAPKTKMPFGGKQGAAYQPPSKKGAVKPAKKGTAPKPKSKSKKS